MSVIFGKFGVDLPKPQPCKYFIYYGPRKPKPRLKGELRKQQYNVTLFDCNHLAHVIVLWQMQQFVCHCTVFALFYFEFEGNFPRTSRVGLYLEGRFYQGVFLHYEFGRLILYGTFTI